MWGFFPVPIVSETFFKWMELNTNTPKNAFECLYEKDSRSDLGQSLHSHMICLICPE